MKSPLFALSVALLPLQLYAVEIASWENLSGQAGNGQNVLVDPGFEEGGEIWGLHPKISTFGNYGDNGNQGVKIKWASPSQSPPAIRQRVRLKPDRVYTLSLRVRPHELKGADNSKLRVQLKAISPDPSGRTFYNGKAIYAGKRGEWRTEVMKFNTSGAQKELECELVIFFAQLSMGEVDLDDIELTEDAPVWRTWLTLPRRTWLDAKGETVEFASHPSGYDYPGIEKAKFRCLIELRHPGLEEPVSWDLPVVDRRIRFNTGVLPEGDAILDLTLIDEVNQVVLQNTQTSLSIRNRPEQMPVEIDEYGRTLLHGKPFLPIGIYSTTLREQELAALKGTAFNLVLPYGSMNLTLGADKPGVESIRKVLDRAHEQDLRVIFSVKSLYPRIRFSISEWAGISDRQKIVETLAEGLKDHPALFAWYVADELPATFAPQIENWRRRINRLDPGHPVFATYHRPNELGDLGMGQDIVAVDPYPIDNERSRDMERVWRYMGDARHFVANGSGHAALYLVPQVFNKGVLDPKTRDNLSAYQALYRSPTEHEMLAMSVLGAIMGAKGFVYYSLQDILHRGPDPQQFATRWPEICRVAAQMQELAPFILSREASPEIELEVKSGKIEARLMKSEAGKNVLLIAAVGPGEAEAVITLPEGATPLKSSTGLTTLAEGRYHFKATDIACDILK